MFISLNVLINILAATFFGAIIGLERELTNKFAGFRTNILVCLGSCIFTILSVHAFPLAADNLHPAAFGDPARIAAQILTGIGFIGGGTILKHGSSVYGPEFYAALAKAFLMDKDGPEPEEKLCAYYKYIVMRGNRG